MEEVKTLEIFSPHINAVKNGRETPKLVDVLDGKYERKLTPINATNAVQILPMTAAQLSEIKNVDRENYHA